jgi:hypothetical protein
MYHGCHSIIFTDCNSGHPLDDEPSTLLSVEIVKVCRHVWTLSLLPHIDFHVRTTRPSSSCREAYGGPQLDRSSYSDFPIQDSVSVDVKAHEVADMAMVTRTMLALVANSRLPPRRIAAQFLQEFGRQRCKHGLRSHSRRECWPPDTNKGGLECHEAQSAARFRVSLRGLRVGGTEQAIGP